MGWWGWEGSPWPMAASLQLLLPPLGPWAAQTLPVSRLRNRTRASKSGNLLGGVLGTTPAGGEGHSIGQREELNCYVLAAEAPAYPRSSGLLTVSRSLSGPCPGLLPGQRLRPSVMGSSEHRRMLLGHRELSRGEGVLVNMLERLQTCVIMSVRGWTEHRV